MIHGLLEFVRAADAPAVVHPAIGWPQPCHHLQPVPASPSAAPGHTKKRWPQHLQHCLSCCPTGPSAVGLFYLTPPQGPGMWLMKETQEVCPGKHFSRLT